MELNGKILKLDTDYTLSYSNNIKVGTATVKAVGKGNYSGTVSKTFTISYEGLSASCRTHVQDFGWQGWVASTSNNVGTSGTTGQSKRLEGIKINVTDSSGDVLDNAISYRTHVQDYGWQGWVDQGSLSGTTGESKRLEAIQIKLNGKYSERYDIYYRVHAQDIGWMDWACNGEEAGTAGYSDCDHGQGFQR